MNLHNLLRGLWALTLVTLPVTSFRYLPFFGGGTVVRPLALYPLTALLLLLAWSAWRRQISPPWPRQTPLLAAFLLAALASTALGLAFAPLPLRGVDYLSRALRALLTLPIGLAFFFAAAWMNRTEEDLRFSLRWLLLGLAAQILWAAAQFIGLNTGHRAQLKAIQELFSVRGLVKNKRVSGFTFEPSWLAAQLGSLYLPWLTACLLAGWRLWRGNHPWREISLTLGALAVLLATYSRSGLVITLLAGSVTLALTGGEARSRFWRWLTQGLRPSAPQSFLARWRVIFPRLGMLLGLAALLAAAFFFLADKGYISRLWTSDFESVWGYLVNTSLGPRAAYASAAMTAFDQNPLFGVGLGASGFYIYPNLPDAVLVGVSEIAQALSPASGLFPNPKNLYVRLLAETGLAGGALFAAFWLSCLADALQRLRSSQTWQRVLGIGAFFSLAALALMAFSQDSFALPELWLGLGLAAGAPLPDEISTSEERFP